MRVIIAGDLKKPILLDTKEATAVYIETDDGRPNFILRMLPNGQGWIQSIKGKDKNFDMLVKQLIG